MKLKDRFKKSYIPKRFTQKILEAWKKDKKYDVVKMKVLDLNGL